MASDEFRGPASFSMPGWTVLAQRGLPATLASYRQHATVSEQFNESSDEGDAFFAAVGRASQWPSLVITQRFSPCQGGFDPGVAFVPTTRTMFVGAGTRLLAYRIDDRPVRLWEDVAEMGFYGWSVHDSAVLMSAELELAAWDHSGAKLWTRFVEPPWNYEVVDGRVLLDVMGDTSNFDILSGS